MALILDQISTERELYSLVEKAEKYVVFICPYASDNESAFYDFYKLKKDNVLWEIFFTSPESHKTSNQDDLNFIFKKYGRKKNVLIHPVPSSHGYFHCKCYFNESDFILSSMNLSYFSRFSRSIECSVLFNKVSDSSAFNDCMNWFFDKFCDSLFFKDQKRLLDCEDKLRYCICCGVNIASLQKQIFCVYCYHKYIYRNMFSVCNICGDHYEQQISRYNPICIKCRGIKPIHLYNM